MPSAQLTGQLFMLRQTVVFPWESVDQLMRDYGTLALGDPLVPGTAAWHLRHIVEIFRLHARTVLQGIGAKREEIDACVPSPDEPIDPIPSKARDALLADIDSFSSFILKQDDQSLERRFAYGSDTDIESMIACMAVHVTWHAAAVHYCIKWKG